MNSLSRLFAAFVVIVIALVTEPAASNAAEDKAAGLFVNLTTMQTSMAGHALAFADSALKRGHPVIIFLNHDAALIAAEGVPQTSFQGRSLTDRLNDLIAAGAKVFVCRMCMEGHGMTEPHLVKGAVSSKPELVHGYLFDPAYKVMTW